MQGPEDSPGWKEQLGQSSITNTICRSCGKEITFWHCADMGCVWCAQCGTNAKDIRDKRKNGT